MLQLKNIKIIIIKKKSSQREDFDKNIFLSIIENQEVKQNHSSSPTLCSSLHVLLPQFSGNVMMIMTVRSNIDLLFYHVFRLYNVFVGLKSSCCTKLLSPSPSQQNYLALGEERCCGAALQYHGHI